MIILALTLTAWAVLHRYARRHQKRQVAYVSAPPVISPAQIERERKERERAEKAAERERIKAEKERAAKEQAEIDIPYYEIQLSRYYEMIGEARASLKANRRRVEVDREMNQYSAVVPEKIVAKHITERDKSMKLVIKLENQIHAAEKKLSEAQRIAAN